MIRPSLVLVPGLLCDRDLWRDQIPALAPIAEVHVADLRDHDSIADMAASILDAAPEPFSLAGLSMGGYVALEVMRRAPERVTRLALLNTTSRADTEAQTARRRRLMALAVEGRFGEAVEELLGVFLSDRARGDRPLVSRVRDMAMRVGAEAFLRQQRAIIGRLDGAETLRAVSCPTLIVAADRDVLIPPALQEEMHRLVRGATLRVIDGCGHLSTMERPDEVTRALTAWLGGPER